MLAMRALATLSGSIALMAVILATIANRGFDDADTATSVLIFGFAAAATCAVCLRVDRKQTTIEYSDDRDH